MSAALTQLVPILTGANWQDWAPLMEAYLMAQGQWYTIMEVHPEPSTTPDNSSDVNAWDSDNATATGNIRLWLAPAVHVKLNIHHPNSPAHPISLPNTKPPTYPPPMHSNHHPNTPKTHPNTSEHTGTPQSPSDHPSNHPSNHPSTLTTTQTPQQPPGCPCAHLSALATS
ncbi:hypothetical protein HYDPIDRAFT_25752 [Hydnomerulius pinastri MD-312]|nr:hypothetical protein HYDPIDRAFT_25752 [Hydnomerulius pinastri MD-312]